MKLLPPKSSYDNSGFIALTSVLVIAGLLIIIGASLGYTGFFARVNILDGEFKETSLGLAEACAEIARVEIANNANYAAHTTFPDVRTFGSESCSIISVTGSYTVRTQAERGNSFSNIEAVFNRTSSDVIVTSWKELPKF